jgi:hypothetical protein
MAGVAEERDEAFEGQEHAAAFALVPGYVADVVVALAPEHFGGDHVEVAGLLDEARVGPVEAREDAVEVEVPPLIGGDALEVLERDERVPGLGPARFRRRRRARRAGEQPRGASGERRERDQPQRDGVGDRVTAPHLIFTSTVA